MNKQYTSTIFCILAFCLYTGAANSYNQSLAMDALYYNRAVYCPSDSITFWNCGIACNYNRQMQDTKGIFTTQHHGQAMTAYDRKNNRIVAVFRGTVDTKNLIQDLKFNLV